MKYIPGSTERLILYQEAEIKSLRKVNAELLNACKEAETALSRVIEYGGTLKTHAGGDDADDPSLEIIRAAIAKAEGGE